MKFKNTNTGLYFKVGHCFTEACKHKASPLNRRQAAIVKATFDNVEKADNGDCTCDACRAQLTQA